MKTTFTFLLLLIGMVSMAQDKIYVHTATSANIDGNLTIIDHPDLNNNPNAPIVYVNRLGSTYNNNVSGLYYFNGKWSIYNESGAPMVEGAEFNIYIASDPNDVFTHIATAANTNNHVTTMDHPSLNGFDPGPYIAMSHYYNPNSIYNTGNFGQYYSASNRRLFNEDQATTVPEGAAFKVLVNGGAGSIPATHASNASNTTLNYTVIDDFDLNGNPDATFVMSHYWGLDGAPSQVYLDAVLGVWYNGSNWVIYIEDTSIAFPEDVYFDIIIADEEVLSVEENQLAATLKMYPNPAKDVVTITANTTITSIDVYNLLGQNIATFNDIGANTMQVDVSSYAAGNYFVKVTADQSIETLKLVKK